MWSLIRYRTSEFAKKPDDFSEFILDSSDWKNYTLGRIGDIRCPSIFVSRYHCEIEYRHSSWWIRDTNSSNGTFVNDERIDHWTQLNHNDRITLGDSADDDDDEEEDVENSFVIKEETFILKIVNSVKAEFEGMPILEPMVNIDPPLLPKNTNKRSKRVGKKRNKSRVCALCNKSFDRKSTFDYHLNFHSGLRPYKCYQCNPTTSFRSIYHLRSHEKKKHPFKELTALPHRVMNDTINVSKTSPMEVTYTNANHRPSNSAKRRPLEVKSTPNEPNYGLDFLNSTVKKIMELPSNAIVEESKVYKCAHCKGKKVFSDKKRYQLHEAVHKAKKTFICKFCAFRSLKEYELIAHVSVNHATDNDNNQANNAIDSELMEMDSPIQVIYDSRLPFRTMGV